MGTERMANKYKGAEISEFAESDESQTVANGTT